jgi:hypothetical protein
VDGTELSTRRPRDRSICRAGRPARIPRTWPRRRGHRAHGCGVDLPSRTPVFSRHYHGFHDGHWLSLARICQRLHFYLYLHVLAGLVAGHSGVSDRREALGWGLGEGLEHGD